MAIHLLKPLLILSRWNNSRRLLTQAERLLSYSGVPALKTGSHSTWPISSDQRLSRTQIRCNMTDSVDFDLILNKFPTKELRFDNPYGHVAAQEWGNPQGCKKVFCIHGWLDNSGSFKLLIPALLNLLEDPSQYHVVALDLPGMGLSSHLPTGAIYSTMTHILEIRRIIRELKWEKVTLISHSLGAHLSYLYSSMYPKQVETMVSIDLPHPMSAPVNYSVTSLVSSIEDHFKCEYSHGDDPTDNMGVLVYSKQDAVDRIMQGHSNALTKRSAEIMLERGSRKERWGYTFNRDVRLRSLWLEMRLTDDHMFDFLNFSFRPNLFSIEASLSPYKRAEAPKKKFYDMYRLKCPLFRSVALEGTHHLHMNDPMPVAQEINKFLRELDSRDKGDSAKGEGSNLNRL